ncbi:glutamine amidotransferase-related protein [Pendulispora albinea]|uniref:CTP synthase (glutamine hydrolyzing) n=1 Tax=Pendulispora albinea TaxID=2741071 RepID=A0ABZ2MA94_9BACT
MKTNALASSDAKPRVAVIGDYNERNKLHIATHEELVTAGARAEWVHTKDIGDPAARLVEVDAVFIAPSSPFANQEAALAAIRYAREQKIPLMGTCGGYQHVVLELVRNGLGVADAAHAEDHPSAERLAVTPLVCSVAGQRLPVLPVPGTRAAALYGEPRPIEPYYCNYGMNPEYEASLSAAGLKVTGRDEEGRARIVELERHPFYLATLYVFQDRSPRTKPHPFTAAFLEAARERARSRSANSTSGNSITQLRDNA